MQRILQWLGKVSGAFSVLGIAATIYFSMFYFPDYLMENKQERTKSVNRELIELVQERVYNGLAVDSTLLSNMVEGKEMRYNVEYPYTHDQLMLQARDGFSASKYLPIGLRDSLTSTIDSVVATLRSTLVKTSDSSGTSQMPLASSKADPWSIAAMLLGFVAAIGGTIGIYIKGRQEKAREVEKSVDSRMDEVERQVTVGLRYEQRVINALRSMGINILDEVTTDGEFATDFSIAINNKKYIVSCKLVQVSFIAEGHLERLGQISVNANEPVILVTNCRLTERNKEWLKTFNHRGDLAQVHVIRGYYTGELQDEFRRFQINQSPPSNA